MSTGQNFSLVPTVKREEGRGSASAVPEWESQGGRQPVSIHQGEVWVRQTLSLLPICSMTQTQLDPSSSRGKMVGEFLNDHGWADHFLSFQEKTATAVKVPTHRADCSLLHEHVC